MELRVGAFPGPVILTTGFSEAVTPERLKEAGVGRVLMKPVSGDDLGWAIHDALTGQL